MQKSANDLRKLKLGSNLRKLLKKERLSEAALARLTGIPQPMINRLAKDKNTNPKLETLQPIVDYFSITFSQLLGEEPLPFEFNDEDDQLENSQLCKEVPVVSWHDIVQELKPTIGIEIVPTNNLVTSKAFGIKVDEKLPQQQFPVGSLLIFEPEKIPQLNDIILIKVDDNFKIEKMTNEQLQLINCGRMSLRAVLVESRPNYS